MARRRQHSGEFKARVVVQALKGAKTVNEIASRYGVHPVQVAQWKRQALDELPHVFGDGRARGIRECRRGAGAAVRADRAVEGGVGVGEKKSWSAPVR
jgi:transposase-like protein